MDSFTIPWRATMRPKRRYSSAPKASSEALVRLQAGEQRSAQSGKTHSFTMVSLTSGSRASSGLMAMNKPPKRLKTASRRTTMRHRAGIAGLVRALCRSEQRVHLKGRLSALVLSPHRPSRHYYDGEGAATKSAFSPIPLLIVISHCLPAALLVGTYEKVLFGFALHLETAKGASRFTPLFSAPGHLETIKSVAANSKVRLIIRATNSTTITLHVCCN